MQSIKLKNGLMWLFSKKRLKFKSKPTNITNCIGYDPYPKRYENKEKDN